MVKVPLVDKSACVGCTACAGICPKVFRMGADGKSEVYAPHGDSEEGIQRAIDSCPVGAIGWK